MKKGLIFLLGIVSFFGINTVSADTTPVISHWYDNFEKYIEDYNIYKDNIDFMINYWEENYSSIYPNYVIVERKNGFYTTSTGPGFQLAASDDNNVLSSTSSMYIDSDFVISFDSDTGDYIYDEPTELNYQITLFNFGNPSINQQVHVLLSKGFISGHNINYLIPTFYFESLNFTSTEIKLQKGVNYPGLVDLYNGTYIYNPPTYAELEFDDIISSPLDALSKVKDSIVGIFDTITEFISLLPETMQTFLYLSFTVAIILGLLKIIL